MSDSRHSSHSKSFQTNCRFADAVSTLSVAAPVGGDDGGVNPRPSPMSSSHDNAILGGQLRGVSVSMASSDNDASCVRSVGGGVNPLLPTGTDTLLSR